MGLLGTVLAVSVAQTSKKVAKLYMDACHELDDLWKARFHILSVAQTTTSWPRTLRSLRSVKHFVGSGFRNPTGERRFLTGKPRKVQIFVLGIWYDQPSVGFPGCSARYDRHLCKPLIFGTDSFHFSFQH